MDSEKKVLTPADVAQTLGVNRKTVYDELKAGRIPHVKMGDKYIIGRVAFDRWLEGNQVSKVS